MVKNYHKFYYSKTEYIAYFRNNQTTNSSLGVVFLHGFKSDMNGSKVLFVENFCCERKISFIKFDYSGHGMSSGKFEDGNIGLWLENCLKVIDELTSGPQILIGSSMGGWLMLLVAIKRPERIKALIGIAAAPDFTEDLIWNNLENHEQQEFIQNNTLEMKLNPSDDGYFINYQLIEEARKHLLLRNKIAINCPTYLFHGMNDEIVPYETSLSIAKRIKSKEVSIHIVKNADHRFSEPENLSLISKVIDKIISNA